MTLHTHMRMDGSWAVTGAGRRLPRRLMPAVRVVLRVESGATAYRVLLPAEVAIVVPHRLSRGTSARAGMRVQPPDRTQRQWG
jgi:hypothetical protein